MLQSSNMTLPEDVHTYVSQLMSTAENMLRTAYDKKVAAKYKSLHINDLELASIVTETDTAIDTFLRSELRKKYPDFGFVTEESDELPKKGYNWIIDPIDGTFNFAHHIPLCAISIALWKDNTPVYACVTLPLQNERLHAEAGRGLYLNDERVQLIKKEVSPEKAYVSMSMVGPNDIRVKTMEAVADITSFPRYLGSCVYQSALVVLGRIDSAVYLNLALWDIAAVLLFAQEAGLICKFVTASPKIDSPSSHDYGYTLVIGQPTLTEKIHAHLVTVLSK